MDQSLNDAGTGAGDAVESDEPGDCRVRSAARGMGVARSMRGVGRLLGVDLQGEGDPRGENAAVKYGHGGRDRAREGGLLEGEGAVLKYRDVMGATDPSKAAEGTIRKVHAKSIGENSVHGSDAPETAAIEIAQFFSGNEIVG